MSKDKYPSIDYVRQCFSECDGRLFWLERPRDHFATERGWKQTNGKHSGKEAGSIARTADQKQWVVFTNYEMVYRSHIVWALHNGEWPKWPMEIDHKDRNRLNDRIENLRISTHWQNTLNVGIKSNNTSGYKGVCWDKRAMKWMAKIQVHGRNIFLGYFQDPTDAHVAYAKAALEHHGEFACVEGKK